jgi:heat-inducible transcriptional repressor
MSRAGSGPGGNRHGGGVQLSERDREILRDVIDTYLTSGSPVSSRRVAKHPRHELSAASIRNVMADLEEMGFLQQPHSSAGRVPTTLGYHVFIDSLMQSQSPSPQDLLLIDEQLTGEGGDLTAAASQLLSKLSCQIGIVVTPDLGSSVLRTIEFVPLSGSKVLCVSASTSGFIDHKVVEVEEPLTREQLIEVSNYLTETFSLMTMVQMRDRLVELMEDTRAQVDEMLRRAVTLAQRGLGFDDGPNLVIEGKESLLQQPELADLARVRRLFETFNDKARVVDLLNRCLDGDGVRVVIGEESDLTSELDFSLIVKPFRVDGHTQGGLGLFGPSRMEYPRLIPLVDYLGDRLTAALATTMAGSVRA